VPGPWPSAMRLRSAADTWHFSDAPGKMGRLVPHRPYFWGIWPMGTEQVGGNDLMTFLSQREVVAKLSIPAAGYDIPPFLSMADLPVWAELEPPKGTLYNYPVRPHHDAEYYIVGSSAPPDIGVQDLEPVHDPGDGRAHRVRSDAEAGDRLGEKGTRGHPSLSDTSPDWPSTT